MFDGLKEKLTSFTEDVEEDAETTDPEAVEAEGESEAESGAGDSAATEGAPDGAAEDAAGPDAAVAAGPEAAVDDAAAIEEDIGQPPEEAPAEPAPEEPAAEEPAADAPADADTGEESPPPEEPEEGGRGLTERAKLFATGKTVIDEDDLDAHLEELEFALLRSDVEMEVAQAILEGVEENLVGETRRRLSSTGNLVRDALREALYDVISVGQFDFDSYLQAADKPVVIVFTGVNGVGKTTTIAKLAAYLEERGLSSVLANGDTYRAGANEQLQEHADALGKPVISHEQGSDPAAVLYDAVEYAEANDVDVVLGDTAGRLHTSEGLMDQLGKIDRVVEPDLTLFVDEAVAGQDAVNRAREFDEAAGTDGSVLTKADADPQGGAAISIAYVTGKPILFLGTGQGYDDLDRFDPEEVVDRLLG
jgi:fused signal recognition particle receptor